MDVKKKEVEEAVAIISSDDDLAKKWCSDERWDYYRDNVY
jgi:hypothetical protein